MKDLEISVLEELNLYLAKKSQGIAKRPYDKNQIFSFVDIVKNDLMELLPVFEKYLENFPLNLTILEYEKVTKPFDSFFFDSRVLALEKFIRIKNNSQLIEKLNSFQLNSLKDYQKIKYDLPETIKFYESFLDYTFNSEERLYLTLIIILFIGLNDVIELFTNLFSISKQLEKEGIKFSYKKLIYLIGINNLHDLSRVYHILDTNKNNSLDTIFLEFSSLANNRDKENKRGCPFILYEPKLVSNYLSILEVFMERIYINLNHKNLEITNYSGFKIFFYNYSYDEKNILKYDFIKKI